MSAGEAWLKAFPLPEAEKAVRAIVESWTTLASKPRPGFDYHLHEPKLTKMLRGYCMNVTAPALGLRGFWGAENFDAGKYDPDAVALVDPFRTDIIYQWMGSRKRLELVFEFKKLAATDSSRAKYLDEEEGLGRFVHGPYSKRAPVALMVGILMDVDPTIVSALKRSIHTPRWTVLDFKKTATGDLLHIPSTLFPAHAEFDTEHLRSVAMAPAHGTIRVSHMFLQFNYPPPKKAGRAKVLASLDEA